MVTFQSCRVNSLRICFRCSTTITEAFVYPVPSNHLGCLHESRLSVNDCNFTGIVTSFLRDSVISASIVIPLALRRRSRSPVICRYSQRIFVIFVYIRVRCKSAAQIMDSAANCARSALFYIAMLSILSADGRETDLCIREGRAQRLSVAEEWRGSCNFRFP